MKSAPAILTVILCASCSTVERENSDSAKVATFVALPQLTVASVEIGDGVQKDEAATLSSAYFRTFISTCGMPDDPADRGEFWCVQLWGGYAGSDYGRLWLSKDGQRVLLEPPKSGLRGGTKSILDRYGLANQAVERTGAPPLGSDSH